MNLLPTTTTLDEASRGADTAVLPIGSFEQHGPHLPLTTDTLVACAIASAIARSNNLLLLPPVTMSCSHEHAAWAGTVAVSASTLTVIVTDVAASLQQSGIERLVLVNGHGGNYVLSNIVQQANVGEPRMALFPGRHDWDAARLAAGLSSSTHDDMHAGEIETSLLLHLHPDLVGPRYAEFDHVVERPDLLLLGMRAYTDTGVIGRPSGATAEKGKLVLDALDGAFPETLRQLRSH